MSTKGDKDNSIWYDGRVMAPMWTCGWPVWICWTPWLSIFGTVLTRVITMQIKKISLSFLVFFFYVAYRGLFLWWTGDCSTSCIYILPSYLQYTHCSSLISPCFSVENHVLFHRHTSRPLRPRVNYKLVKLTWLEALCNWYKRITVLISHHSSMLRTLHIVALPQGVMCEMGNWDTLARSPGLNLMLQDSTANDYSMPREVLHV